MMNKVSIAKVVKNVCDQDQHVKGLRRSSVKNTLFANDACPV